MDLGIKGKTAIVCAASKGLGRGCAWSLAREGVNLTICARGEEALNATAAELHKNFGGFSARDADNAYALSARAVRRLLEQHGPAPIVAMLQDLARGTPFARAFQERLGVQYDDFASSVSQ